MLKKLKKLAFLLAAIAVGASTSQAEDAKIKSASFSITVPFKSEINVASSDGARWDTIVPETFPLWADAVVDTKSTGYVERAGIWLGRCTGSGCSMNPRLFFEQPMVRDWKFHHTFSFDTGKIPVTMGGIPVVSIGDDILKACNTQLQSDGATKKHSQNVRMDLSLSVNTRRALSINYQLVQANEDNFDGGDVTRHAAFNMKVNCLAFQGVQAPPEPYSVNVQVEQKGETCPKKTDVTAIIKYKVPATARFRFKVDGKKSELITIKARKVDAGKPGPAGGPGSGTHYLVKRLKTYRLDPGQHTFRVELEGGKGKRSNVKTVDITCPPFKVTSAWLKYEVEDTPVCPKKVTETATFHTTRPGWVKHEIRMQGGLVVSSGKLTSKRVGDKYVATAVRHLTLNAIDKEFMADAVDYPANSGWVPLKVKCLDLTGDFSFVDTGGTHCPREGRALINFSLNMQKDVGYSLDCTNGHYSGVAKAVPDNKGGFIAPALVKFDVEKTTQVTCALKSVAPIQKVHALKGHLFRCVTASGHTSSNDVQVDPKPADGAPRTPAADVKVAPKRTDVDAGKKRREALRKVREAARKKAEAERRRKAKIAAEKAKREHEAAAKRRALLKKRLEAAKKKKLRRKMRRRRNTTTTSSNAQLRVRRLR